MFIVVLARARIRHIVSVLNFRLSFILVGRWAVTLFGFFDGQHGPAETTVRQVALVFAFILLADIVDVQLALVNSGVLAQRLQVVNNVLQSSV